MFKSQFQKQNKSLKTGKLIKTCDLAINILKFVNVLIVLMSERQKVPNINKIYKQQVIVIFTKIPSNLIKLD